MSRGERRTVGERGQITIPKSMREQFHITAGDEVTIREQGDKLVIERPVSRDDLAEGYRKRASHTSDLTSELDGISREANDHLGDAPEW